MSEADETRVRVFCAVELPEDVRAEAARHVARLRAEFPRLKVGWEREEKLHLTLKFLGEIDEARVELLTRAAEAAADATRAFELSIEGAGFFPPRGAPRVLWLRVQDSSRG